MRTLLASSTAPTHDPLPLSAHCLDDRPAPPARTRRACAPSRSRSDTDWDINWSDIGWVRDYFDHMHLEDHQRINHFRNHYELTRKDLLVSQSI